MNPPNPKNRILAYLALVTGILSLGMTFVRWADAPGPVTGFYRLAIAATLTAPLFIHRQRTQKAILLLGELPGAGQIMGGAIALAGIYLVNQSHARAQQEIAKQT